LTVSSPPGAATGGDSPSRTAVDAVRAGDVLTLVVSGDLDAGSGTALETAADAISTTDSVGRVAIDLGDLDFCDTAGVRALVRAHRLITARGVRCSLTRARPHVAWVLQATGAMETLAPEA
jgi:anti-anti-sigma factor